MGTATPGEVVLAHITDAHVAPKGRATAVLKHQSVAIFSDLIDQLTERKVDAALFGGDNIDNRDAGPEDLEAFATMAERLPRFHCILGNHEADVRRLPHQISREDFAARLEGRGVQVGRYCFSEAIGNVRVVGIDTTLVGTHGGYVAPRMMQFLAKELRNAEEDHLVVLGHHLLYRSWEPYVLQAWDQEYLVGNRAEVIALLASTPKVRAYLCGHHHASRIQRIAARGHAGGFYQILTASPVAFPHHARVLAFRPDGIHVETLRPRIPGVIEAGKEAVMVGRKARRYGTLGSSQSFLQYVEGRPSDNEIVLPYDAAPVAERRGISVAGARQVASVPTLG